MIYITNNISILIYRSSTNTHVIILMYILVLGDIEIYLSVLVVNDLSQLE